jgi:hypothetical protein
MYIAKSTSLPSLSLYTMYKRMVIEILVSHTIQSCVLMCTQSCVLMYIAKSISTLPSLSLYTMYKRMVIEILVSHTIHLYKSRIYT